jgi:hypothetical protein
MSLYLYNLIIDLLLIITMDYSLIIIIYFVISFKDGIWIILLLLVYVRRPGAGTIAMSSSLT